jgi:flagellar basal-body rod protein FlgB
MTVGFRDSIGLHAEALVLRERRGEILASNIANAATPNFKARDFDFEQELSRAMGGSGPDRTAPGHFGGAMAEGQLGYRVPVTTSLDGNTVELATEQMEFAEELNVYEIAEILGVTTGRVSQIKKAAVGRLRESIVAMEEE